MKRQKKIVFIFEEWIIVGVIMKIESEPFNNRFGKIKYIFNGVRFMDSI